MVRFDTPLSLHETYVLQHVGDLELQLRRVLHSANDASRLCLAGGGRMAVALATTSRPQQLLWDPAKACSDCKNFYNVVF